jgi:hypothetical protein
MAQMDQMHQMINSFFFWYLLLFWFLSHLSNQFNLLIDQLHIRPVPFHPTHNGLQ